jgi:hypothetical protein
VTNVIVLGRALLDDLADEVRSAAWFAALAEPLTEQDRTGHGLTPTL